VEGAADKPGPGKCNWQALWADKSARQDERDFIRLSGCIAVLMKFLPERQRHKSAKNVNLKIYIICESQQKLQVGKDSDLYMCIYKEHGGNSINIVRSGGWRFLQHDENALPVAGFHRLPSI